MSWKIDAVVLPSAPKKILTKHPAYVKEIDIVGDPLILAIGNKAKLITLEGTFHKPGMGMSQIWHSWVNPLDSMIHHSVALSTPDERRNGNYILSDFAHEERGGHTKTVYYKITLTKGGTHIIL